MTHSVESPDSSPPLAHSWKETDRFVPRKVVRPLQRLMQVGSSSAVVILAATIAALVVANTGLADTYNRLWETPVHFTVGDLQLVHLTLREIVSDALMALFFLLVSLEIKREIVFGELRDPRAAALPIVAALGGMVAPALIYVAFNAGGSYLSGWGIPMATDIAFAVAVITSLGARVPVGARVFLLTLAIVDDLGAILVIAMFYTADLRLAWLVAALTTVLLALILRRLRVRALFPYLALGVVGWFALHESGVHATLIGVVFGLLTPAYALLPAKLYPAVAIPLVNEVADRNADGVVTVDENEANDHTLREIRRLSWETQSPLHRIETRLAPYVAFGIVPLFAFANAGITLPDVRVSEWLSDPVTLGVAVGLVLGKTIGIFSATWLTVRAGVAQYPAGVSNVHVLGLAATGGIGFTVALFVTNLAFDDPAGTEMAKLGVMVGSVVAAVIGYSILRSLPSPRPGADGG